MKPEYLVYRDDEKVCAGTLSFEEAYQLALNDMDSIDGFSVPRRYEIRSGQRVVWEVDYHLIRTCQMLGIEDWVEELLDPNAT